MRTHPRQKVGLVLLGAAMALGSWSCSLSRTPPPPPRQFALMVPPAREARSGTRASFPEALELRDFAASRQIQREFAALDPGTGEIAFSAENYWVEEPEDLLVAALTERFRASGLFPSVHRRIIGLRTRFALAGRVQSFHREKSADDSGGGRAVFVAEFVLFDATQKTGAPLWANVTRVERPVESDEPEAFAKAMSEAVNQAASEVIAALRGLGPVVE